MIVKPLYQVLLLPSREAAARHLSLAEASAWVRTYNEALAAPGPRAVIAEEVDQAERAGIRRARAA
jgi:hypothetical protein